MDPSNITPDLSPKTETETDSDTSKRVIWNSENTMKLIETFEKECRELWDAKHALNKDRTIRQAKLEYLAATFGTNTEEISRKLHNLRTQFNNELRKIKKRATFGESSSGATSGWEYFEPLLFLLREPIANSNETMEVVNLDLAEFQADEEIEFETTVVHGRPLQPQPSLSPITHRPMMRVAASAPNRLPAGFNPMLWNEEPRLYSTNEDECQIFGDFVASELRNLRSRETRNRLKRLIQQAILQITEEEDAHIEILRRNRRDPLN